MLIVSFLALAIVCVYYKEAEFSFHMQIAHIVRSLWVEAISNHGLQPTEIRLYSIITSLTTTSIFCTFAIPFVPVIVIKKKITKTSNEKIVECSDKNGTNEPA